MKPPYRNIIINSSMLFVIATIVEMTLHECGHFTTAILAGVRGISLHHNYAQCGGKDVSFAWGIAIAGAGPFVSLLIGIVFNLVCSLYKKRNYLFLFYLYLSVFGYIGFFGYLMIGPLVPYGDTGYIMVAFKLPIWIQVAIAFGGVGALYLSVKGLAKYFVQMGSKEMLEAPDLRKSFMNSLVWYPLYIGIVITTLLNLPVPTFASLSYPMFSPFTLFWIKYDLAVKKYHAQHWNTDMEGMNKIQPIIVAAFIVIIIINRLLVFGIHV